MAVMISGMEFSVSKCILSKSVKKGNFFTWSNFVPRGTLWKILHSHYFGCVTENISCACESWVLFERTHYFFKKRNFLHCSEFGHILFWVWPPIIWHVLNQFGCQRECKTSVLDLANNLRQTLLPPVPAPDPQVMLCIADLPSRLLHTSASDWK